MTIRRPKPNPMLRWFADMERIEQHRANVAANWRD